MPANRTGIANLPLHHGKAPRWLFERMVKLAREVTVAIVSDYGPDEMLRRLAHPRSLPAPGRGHRAGEVGRRLGAGRLAAGEVGPRQEAVESARPLPRAPRRRLGRRRPRRSTSVVARRYRLAAWRSWNRQGSRKAMVSKDFRALVHRRAEATAAHPNRP